MTVLPFKDEITDDITTTGTAPSQSTLEEALAVNGVSVHFARSAGRFVLAVSTGSKVTYHTAWAEVESASGEVVAPASTNYVAGKAFVGSNPKRYYTWNGIGAELKRLGDDYEIIQRLKTIESGINKSADLELGADGALALADDSKRTVFDDLWRVYVGEFGDIDYGHTEDGVAKPYMLNELWFTYDEALEIHAVSVGKTINASTARTHCAFSHHLKTRTVYPVFMGHGDVQASFEGICAGNEKIEVLRVVDNAPNNAIKSLSYAFYRCYNLRHIYGNLVIVGVGVGKPAFEGCAKLETLFLKDINRDIDLRDCKALSLESVSFMVANRRNDGTAVTITVHPDVYAKLTDGALPEWGAVLTDALAKNITFATI